MLYLCKCSENFATFAIIFPQKTMKNDIITLHDRNFRVMIPAAEIDKAVSRIAERINADYAATPLPPVLVSVLSGSFMYLADLSRKLDFANEILFVKISSYEGTASTGEVKMHLGVDFDIEGRDLIIVEDIVETGTSIRYMTEYLRSKNPRSVEVCTLFYKPEKYRGETPVKYRAMDIGNEFIVGYGLDYNQLGRSLKDIYVVCDE